MFSPVLKADFIHNEGRVLFIDKELKLRAKNIFVDATFNGSEFEILARPHEIIKNFNWKETRKQYFNDALEQLIEVIKFISLLKSYLKGLCKRS